MHRKGLMVTVCFGGEGIYAMCIENTLFLHGLLIYWGRGLPEGSYWREEGTGSLGITMNS